MQAINLIVTAKSKTKPSKTLIFIWKAHMNELKVIELFAGIGAPRKALENIGYKVNSIPVEINQHAINSYNKIYGENHNITDVSTFHYPYNDIDLLVGGFPCQDLSTAGLGRGMDLGSNTRSSLAWQLIRVIEEVRPQMIMIENVKALLNKKHRENFELLLLKLKSLGYNVSYDTLKSSDFGIPQKRERVFIVGSLKQEFKFESLKRRKSPPIKLFLDNDNVNNEKLEISSAMKKYIVAKDRTGKFRVSSNMIINPSIIPTITTREGQCRIASSTYICKDFPLNHNVYGVDLMNHNVRRLSSLEMWKLMGFSQLDHKRAMRASSARQLRKQAGNSISVNVLEAIFKEMNFKGARDDAQTINFVRLRQHQSSKQRLACITW